MVKRFRNHRPNPIQCVFSFLHQLKITGIVYICTIIVHQLMQLQGGGKSDTPFNYINMLCHN